MIAFTFLYGRFAGYIVPGSRSRYGRNYRSAVEVRSVIAHSTQSRPLYCTWGSTNLRGEASSGKTEGYEAMRDTRRYGTFLAVAKAGITDVAV